ncbi:hypothetical protein OG234_13490 [Streptomyces sp. NBC_01420]
MNRYPHPRDSFRTVWLFDRPYQWIVTPSGRLTLIPGVYDFFRYATAGLK